jgi:hypothetical protein
MTDLTPEQLHSIKKSYFNILGLFLGQEKIESKYLRCLLKWGFQLSLTSEDMRSSNVDMSSIQFRHPEEAVQKLEALYHLVYMIYLDDVVEDVELEVATTYAQKLGFKPAIVNELFNSIATADHDGMAMKRDVRKEVMDFMKINHE